MQSHGWLLHSSEGLHLSERLLAPPPNEQRICPERRFMYSDQVCRVHHVNLCYYRNDNVLLRAHSDNPGNFLDLRLLLVYSLNLGFLFGACVCVAHHTVGRWAWSCEETKFITHIWHQLRLPENTTKMIENLTSTLRWCCYQVLLLWYCRYTSLPSAYGGITQHEDSTWSSVSSLCLTVLFSQRRSYYKDGNNDGVLRPLQELHGQHCRILT